MENLQSLSLNTLQPETLRHLSMLLESDPQNSKQILRDRLLHPVSLIFDKMLCPAAEMNSNCLMLAIQIFDKLVPGWQVAHPIQKEMAAYLKANAVVLEKLWNCSEEVHVKKFVVRQLGRFDVHDYAKWEEEQVMEKSLLLLMDAFCDKDVALSKVGVDVLLHVFCRTTTGWRWLFDDLVEKEHPAFSSQDDMQDESMHQSNEQDRMQDENFELISRLHDKCKQDTILHLRYMEWIIAIASRNEQLFRLCRDAELLDQIVDRLSSASDDLLELLNVLELVQKLVAIPFESAMVFLIESNVFEMISEQLYEKYVGDPMVEGYFMSAIGQVTYTLGQHLSSLKKDQLKSSTTQALKKLLPMGVFFKICKHVDSENKRLQLISIRVVSCVLATSSETLHAFLEDSKKQLRHSFFEHLFLGHNTDTQNAFLHGMAQIFSSPLLSSQDLQDIITSYKDFHQEYKDTTNFVDELLSILKVPFTEIRFATYFLLESLARHTFTARQLLQHPLLLREMLDRKLEQDHQCMEKKYEFLQQLSDTIKEHEDLRQLLSNADFIELRTYIHRGPFFYHDPQAIFEEEAG